MKRIWKSLLCLTLALCMVGSAMAESANLYMNSENGGVGRSAMSVAVVGDTLYLLTTQHYYEPNHLERWQPGMKEPETILDGLALNDGMTEEDEAATPSVSYLFACGDALYGLDRYTGAVSLLVDGEGKAEQREVFTLDPSLFVTDYGDYQDYAELYNCFTVGDTLYLCTVSWNEQMATKLHAIDMTTGKPARAALDLSDAGSRTEPVLCADENGRLLTVGYEGDNPYNEETGKMNPTEIREMNPETGDTQKLCTVNLPIDSYVSGILCRGNTAYLYVSSSVYAVDLTTGEASLSAVFPVRTWGGSEASFALLGDNLMVSRSWHGVFVRELGTKGEGCLRVYGASSEYLLGVMDKYPEINATESSEYYGDMEKLANAIISGDGGLDVMLFDSRYQPLDKLIDKGYCADLSGYPELAAMVERMDSRLTEMVRRDGKLYGIPVQIDATMLRADEDAMEALGLTADDLPTNWMEFLDFVDNFYYDYGEEHPDVKLFNGLNLRSQLMDMIWADYIAWQMKTEGMISFDTPLFRMLMERLEAIDFTEIDPYAAMGDKFYEDEERVDEYYSSMTLFERWGLYSQAVKRMEKAPIVILAMDEGEEPILPVGIGVLTISARCANPDQAATFVKGYAEQDNTWSMYHVSLYPDKNDAIEEPNYEYYMQECDAAIAQLEKRIAKTEDAAAKAELEEELKAQKEWKKEREEERYLLTAEDIQRYREQVTKYFYAMPQTPLNDSAVNEELYRVLQQYVEKAIDLNTFVREIDQRLRMMFLEDQ